MIDPIEMLRPYRLALDHFASSQGYYVQQLVSERHWTWKTLSRHDTYVEGKKAYDELFEL